MSFVGGQLKRHGLTHVDFNLARWRNRTPITGFGQDCRMATALAVSEMLLSPVSFVPSVSPWHPFNRSKVAMGVIVLNGMVRILHCREDDTGLIRRYQHVTVWVSAVDLVPEKGVE